ncbi:hypothetical protein [Leifsonia sp. NPDC058230]
MTGLGAVVLGTAVVDLWWLAAASVAAMAVGVTIMRLTRRGSRRRSTHQ